MGETRADCPYDTEVWGVNNGYRQVMKYNLGRDKSQEELTRLTKTTSPEEAFANREAIERNKYLLTAPIGRLDKLFICHRGQEYDADGDPVFNFDELNQLSEQNVEIMSLFNVKELNTFTRYPFRQIVRKFQTMYFSDTIAYMLAYAIHLSTRKVKGVLRLKEPMKIKMFGVDMHSQDEYATERGGIEYFVGVARTLGIKVWIHPDSSVCKNLTGKPYGFFKLDKKVIDPYNIMELQKSVKGLTKLYKGGIIDKAIFNEMKDYLSGVTATGYST
tara:strand:+ start:14338 stop:15159 length:822 start_codon:yes stop_codon:yes gene_type:complete